MPQELRRRVGSMVDTFADDLSEEQRRQVPVDQLGDSNGILWGLSKYTTRLATSGIVHICINPSRDELTLSGSITDFIVALDVRKNRLEAN